MCDECDGCDASQYFCLSTKKIYCASDEKTVRVWYVVVSSDQVFLSENLEIYHLALPLCIQVKEITRNMAGKRVEEITNKVMMIN